MTEADQSGRAPGTRLSEARQAQGLATGDVARRLKLSVAQVEALEAGRYHDLPGLIFVRGFIRNYAKLVKLDPDELLQAAADSLPQPAAHPETPPSQDIPFPTSPKRGWSRFAAVIVAIVGLLAVYEFFINEPPRTVATAPEAAPAKEPVKKASQPLRKEAPPAPPAHPPAAVAPRESRPAPLAEAKSPIISDVLAAAAAAPAPASPPVIVVSRQERPVEPDEREVRFVFEGDSWVEVRDRHDRVIFYQLNASGTARRVSGLPPLTVVVGNAHGVKMTYDGQPVDLARHTKIDVARLTLQ
jgi:cytoskeleton protein RodZ